MCQVLSGHPVLIMPGKIAFEEQQAVYDNI